MARLIFMSTKTFTHAVGLSCCFRQWRAFHSHCRFLHGYSIQVKMTFIAAAGLDERNWVVDFGGLKPIKKWLEDTFDHKTIIAEDDPALQAIQTLADVGALDLTIVDAVGCERFAEKIFRYVDQWLQAQPEYKGRVLLGTVEVSEHDGNSAMVARVEG